MVAAHDFPDRGWRTLRKGEDPYGAVTKRKSTAERSSSDIARRLRRSREAAQLTQETAAKRAGLSAKFISQIENGHVNPSFVTVARLVEDGLGLPLSAFFSDDASGDVRDDLAQLIAMLGGQSATVRRRALRVLRALCDE